MDYFEDLKKGLEKCYKIASKAKSKGFDPEKRIEIKITSDVASRVEGIVGPKGIEKIIRKMEEEGIKRENIAFIIAEKIAKGEIIEGTIASVPPQGGRKHPHQEYVQVDTTNILFICGGAFNGLEKIISQRIGKHLIGFNAEVESKNEMEIGEILRHAQPADLLKHGFIPEFIGRIPVVATLDKLDEKSLMKILKEPKNALLRQYQKLFEFDHVKLHFKDEALRAIAQEALKLDMGARGLRSVLEDIMLDLMFEIPSQSTIRECIVSEDVILQKSEPILLYEKAS